MDAYKSIDHAHQCDVDREAHKENFMDLAVKKMLMGELFEFNDMKFSVQGDVVCRLDEDALAECVANINRDHVLDVEDDEGSKEALLEIITNAAYDLAAELYDSVKWP